MRTGAEAGAGEAELAELALTYWSRVVGLSELMAHYVLAGSALVSRDATGRRPERLERVEVLLAADVPSGAIERL